jgi:hypothetical protein
MAKRERTRPLQGVFSFDRDSEYARVCDCFHGRIDGLNEGGYILTCNEAPWWCPRRIAGGPGFLPEYPLLSNRGVTSDEFDPDNPNGKQHSPTQ